MEGLNYIYPEKSCFIPRKGKLLKEDVGWIRFDPVFILFLSILVEEQSENPIPVAINVSNFSKNDKCEFSGLYPRPLQ